MSNRKRPSTGARIALALVMLLGAVSILSAAAEPHAAAEGSGGGSIETVTPEASPDVTFITPIAVEETAQPVIIEDLPATGVGKRESGQQMSWTGLFVCILIIGGIGAVALGSCWYAYGRRERELDGG
jgi:hypothetical protein